MCAAWCHQSVYLCFFSFFMHFCINTNVIFRSYVNVMCANSITTSTNRGGIPHVQRLVSSIYPCSWSPFPNFAVFNVTETRQQLGNKDINKPNYTTARSLFCVQTTPRLPMNGQGPHTDPKHNLYVVNSQGEPLLSMPSLMCVRCDTFPW